MHKDWSYNAVKMYDLPSPPGFNSVVQNDRENVKKRHEVNATKQERAFGLAMGQGKQIFTLFISSFFFGTSVSVFTIGFIGYNLFGVINSLINVNDVFKKYESPEYSLLTTKILYCILTIIQLGLLCYRINKMGLLPITAADWVYLTERAIKAKETAYNWFDP